MGVPRTRGWTIMNVVMLVAFAASVLVQLNDPDPMAWMLVYGAAALACTLDLAGRGSTMFTGLLALTAGAWAATLAPAVLGQVPFLEMFGAWEMKNVGVEESREMYGLLIITVWMTVLARRARG